MLDVGHRSCNGLKFVAVAAVGLVVAAGLRLPAYAEEAPDPAWGSMAAPGYGDGADAQPIEISASRAIGGTTSVVSYKSADYVSAGVGGMRNNGSGDIEITGVSGRVLGAFLFWQGPTNEFDSGVNALAYIDGHEAPGVNIGFSSDNCWGYENSQAYRADVTEFVQGNGTYTVNGLVHGYDINVNGASLVVVFDDGDESNDRRITMYNGNDSNEDNAYDPEGWDVHLNAVAYESGPATVELHVSDGQSFTDDAVKADDTVIAPRGPVFQGNSVPGGAGPQGDGGLWDIRRFDIAGALVPGEVNDVRVTTGLYSDCLSLVLAIVAVPPTDLGSQYFDFTAEELFGHSPFYGFAEDPVNTASGNQTSTVTDIDVPDSSSGMDFERSYNSGDKRITGLGRGWTSSYDVEVSNASEDGEVTVTLGDGRRVRFAETGVGTYTRPQGFYGELYGWDGNYSLEMFDGTLWEFGAAGRLTSVTFADGQRLTLTRVDGRLTGILSSTGASHTLEYTGEHLTKVTADDGRSVGYEYDAAGMLAAVTDPTGGKTRYDYDAAGRLTKVTDPSGVVQIENTYDDAGRVRTQSTGAGSTATFQYDDATGSTQVSYEPSGEVVTYHHDPLGQLTGITDTTGADVRLDRQGDGELASVTDRHGNRHSYTYNRYGDLLTVTGPQGDVQKYDYDYLHRLVSSANALGETTLYEFSGDERIPSKITDPTGAVTRVEVTNGLIRSIEDADHVITSYEYDTKRLMTKSVDGAGKATTFAYDAAGNQTSVTSPEGRVLTMTYDGSGRLRSETTAHGKTTYDYDDAGRLSRLVDAEGGVTTYTFGPDGQLASMTDPTGATTEYDFDAYQQLVRTVRPGGAEYSSAYGPLGRLDTTTDPLGRSTSYGYDATGQPIRTTAPDGTERTTTYDAAGRVSTQTDALGRMNGFEYDAADRVTAIVGADGTTTRFEYDAAGRLVLRTDPDGGETQWSYTAAGRLASQTDPTGVVTSIGYDEAGRRATETDGSGATTRVLRDADGLETGRVLPSGATTRIGRDASGRPVSVTGPEGITSETALDALGRVVGEIDGAGAERGFGYDGRGSITRATDALGGMTAFGYDARGNRVKVTDAAGHVTTADYDLADQLTRSTDALGRSTTLDHDSLGRVSRIADPSGRVATSDYDAAGRLVRMGFQDGSATTLDYAAADRPTAIADAGGALRYEYDDAGRPTKVTSANGDVLTYAYDRSGRRTSLTYPDGSTVTYAYDRAGRLVSSEHSSAGKVEYSYDEDGRLNGRTSPDGSKRSWTYTSGRLTGYTDGEGTSGFAYDDAGRLTSITGQDQAIFTYDAAGELLTADGAGGREEFTYDAVGNITRYVNAAGNVSRTYDAGNQLKSASDGTTYAYDEAGRLTSVTHADGSRLTLAYDVRGLLVQQVSTTPGTDGVGSEIPDPCADALPTINGTAGPDQLRGTAGADVIAGLGGDDVILGGNGTDTIDGGSGNDRVEGQLGDDTLTGGDGVDVLLGDNGVDSLEGGPEADSLDGGSGDDHCEKEPARESCEIDLPSESRSEITTITRGYDADRLLSHVAVAAPDGTVDEYDLTWDRATAVPSLVGLTRNGVRTSIITGPESDYTVTSGQAGDLEYDALGNVVGGGVAVADRYTAFGQPVGQRLDVGIGFRGELHVGELVYLRVRDLHPATGRFTKPDSLDGVAGTTTVGNRYHYADNDPIGKQDPLGLRPTTDAELDRQDAGADYEYLEEIGAVQQAGFPFWLFNPWHRATQLDLAGKVGGVIECPVAEGGPNGGTGRVDVCAGKSIWEVKYFGPNGIANAVDQLARYMAADPSLRLGRSVSHSELIVGPTKLVAFSASSAGVRLYVPVPWLRAIDLDPLRAPELRLLPEATLAALLAAAGAHQDKDTPGFQFPDIELPEIPAPDPATTGTLAGAGAIILCIMFCIPTPWPVL